MGVVYFEGGSVLFFVLERVLCHFTFAIILTRKRELVVLLSLSSDVLLLLSSYALPHGAEGWSTVCDCGIS